MEEKKIYKDPFLVVLEGADATGKHTQSRRLLQSFETQCPKNAPVPYMTSFPVYDSPSSYFVTNYLSNAYDSIYYDNEPINVKLICDFYAMDHFDGWFNRNVPDNDHHYSYDQAYRECHPIILDRSWISNMIYQPILLFTRMLHKDKESPENRRPGSRQRLHQRKKGAKILLHEQRWSMQPSFCTQSQEDSLENLGFPCYNALTYRRRFDILVKNYVKTFILPMLDRGRAACEECGPRDDGAAI